MFRNFFAFFILMMNLSTLVYVASSASLAEAMTADQTRLVETAIDDRETKPQELDSTISGLEANSKIATKDEGIFTSLARLKFFRAINDSDKSARIKKYQGAIDDADKALALNPESAAANFWKAAAMGKQGLDIGVSKALKNAHAMKDDLEIVLKKDERYEQAGAHRAMGRLYYELPGWPLSFGDNKIALEHLKKAVELAPTSVANHVYLAQVEIKLGEKDDARKNLTFVDEHSQDPKHAREMSEYTELAKKLRDKL